MRWWAPIAVALLPLFAPPANADNGPGIGAPGIGGEPGINPGASPAAAAVLLCNGVGQGLVIAGAGGGWCDFDFTHIPGVPGAMHTHCEGGGFNPIVVTWQCWRVFPGQPNHPRLADPDLVPDGWGVPWAITGPSPNDQWPPPGLTPAPPPPPA